MHTYRITTISKFHGGRIRTKQMVMSMEEPFALNPGVVIENP